MNDFWAITKDGGRVLMGEPTSKLGAGEIHVRSSVVMKATATIVGAEIEWANGVVSTAWLDRPIDVRPGVHFHADITVEVGEQLIGPRLRV